MSFSNITFLTQKLEDLPKNQGEELAEYLSRHLEDIWDELLWDKQFNDKSEQLSDIAAQVKQEIASGKAEPFSLEKL